MSANTNHIVRLAGFAIGAAIAIGVVLAGRMPQSQAEAPARLSVASKPITELGVSPAGADFLAADLRPGGRRARGVLELDNFTPRPLPVAMRVTSPQRDLDSLVRIRATLRGRSVFAGRLGELRSWTRRPIRVRAGAVQKLQVEAWLPMSIDSGFEGRSLELELEWRKAKT
jgi:hypothetical protein